MASRLRYGYSMAHMLAVSPEKQRTSSTLQCIAQLGHTLSNSMIDFSASGDQQLDLLYDLFAVGFGQMVGSLNFAIAYG